MSIEDRFDIPLVAELALREKQIQQNYRPIIAVHKWFARRPGTLFRGLTLAEFGDKPLSESFFTTNHFPDRVVADPFMGGGTPLLEANRVGCGVQGFDINPMAAWIVREEIEHLDLTDYRKAAARLMDRLRKEVGAYYTTDCPTYGDRDVPVKYFLWVKTIACQACGETVDLFPGHLVAANSRHPRHVLVCVTCGELQEVEDPARPGPCRTCGERLSDKGPAGRGACACRRCGHTNRYPRPEEGPPQHRLFAIEYHNPHRRAEHSGRFFKKPDVRDLEKATEAERRWTSLRPKFVPDQEILPGDETDRLHRWGYRHYREMFSPRQLLGLETSARLIAAVKGERVRHALATNLSDLLRYQNMLCRYDTVALKSLDIFSVHGFPVGLVQCESNLLGITNGNGSSVGSGGWTNIVEKYAKAKAYCDAPFERRRNGSRMVTVPVPGEWIGERRTGHPARTVAIRCQDSAVADLSASSLDAVFTDPPYFGNVQYGELMDFCYVWLRRLVGSEAEGFDRPSTRSPDELTGNATQSRGIEHFAEGLGRVYRAMGRALKPGAPLAFTFHHNRIEAYYAVGMAILDAGLVCSAALPCPAEMGGSIHIHGTGSSIVDTVFVCRAHGRVQRHLLFTDLDGLDALVRLDLAQLREAGLKPTAGDVRCIVFGHLTRMGVWNLRSKWDATVAPGGRLARFGAEVAKFGDPGTLIRSLADKPLSTTYESGLFAPAALSEAHDAVPF